MNSSFLFLGSADKRADELISAYLDYFYGSREKSGSGLCFFPEIPGERQENVSFFFAYSISITRIYKKIVKWI